MALDSNEGIQITEENSPQITKNLSLVIAELSNASSACITVPNFDFGRQLVQGGGNGAGLLKKAIDDLISNDSWGKLKGSVNFQVIDFTKFKDPDILLSEALSSIPKLEDVNQISRVPRHFNDFYPGKVMVVIGPEMIPNTAKLDGFRRMAKYAPTVYIQKGGTNFSQMHERVQEAIGANTQLTQSAIKK